MKPAKNTNRDNGDLYNAAAINPHLSTKETEPTEYSGWEMLRLHTHLLGEHTPVVQPDADPWTLILRTSLLHFSSDIH